MKSELSKRLGAPTRVRAGEHRSNRQAPARYAEWRDFYEQRITGWMRLEQLRAEVARLQDAGSSQSPELLLIHAMHELERLHAELDKS
jgi:hypothetical protein